MFMEQETPPYYEKDFSSELKQLMLKSYDKMTKTLKNTSVAINRLIDEKNEVKLVLKDDKIENLSVVYHQNPHTFIEKVFELLINSGILPRRIESNDIMMFYLVILTLCRYEKIRTPERLSIYHKVCKDDKKYDYCKILRTYLYEDTQCCEDFPINCKCYCISCQLQLKECNCGDGDDEPVIMLGEIL